MGRLLWDSDQPPVAVITYLADQLGIDPSLYDLYAHRVSVPVNKQEWNQPRIHPRRWTWA